VYTTTTTQITVEMMAYDVVAKDETKLNPANTTAQSLSKTVELSTNTELNMSSADKSMGAKFGITAKESETRGQTESQSMGTAFPARVYTGDLIFKVTVTQTQSTSTTYPSGYPGYGFPVSAATISESKPVTTQTTYYSPVNPSAKVSYTRQEK
jgi:hypothetical protein